MPNATIMTTTEASKIAFYLTKTALEASKTYEKALADFNASDGGSPDEDIAELAELAKLADADAYATECAEDARFTYYELCDA